MDKFDEENSKIKKKQQKDAEKPVYGLETFDAASVTSQLETINGIFESVAGTLKSINEAVTGEVQVGPESAVFGSLGKELLKIWDENAATFGDFHANFDEWTKMVSIITANNLNFEADAINMYKDSALTLEGIKEARDELFLESASLLYETNFVQGKTVQYYDEKGNLVTITLDENGKERKRITTDKNGNDVTLYYDNYGNYSVVSKDEAGKKVVKFYDADGNEIERPYTFSIGGSFLATSVINGMASKAATSYIEEHGFDIFSEDFANLIPEAQAEIQSAIDQVNAVGYPDGTPEWQERFESLSPTVQNAFLETVRGKIAEAVSAHPYSITNVIPEDGVYDGSSVVIPGVNAGDLTGMSARDVRFQNGAVIVNSANAVKANIDGETTGLQSITEKIASNDVFNALPESTKEKLSEYLNYQVAQRSNLSKQITEFATGEIKNVGSSIKPKSGGPTAVNLPDLGSPGDDYTRDYTNAAAVARSWNDALQGLDSVEAVTATFNSYGVFFT